MVDYNALGKRAIQNQDSDSAKLDEGESLVYLIPYEGGFPAGMPYVEVEMHRGKASDPFKRSVINSDSKFAQTQAYADALGREVPSPCEIGVWAKENLSGDDARSAKPMPVNLWSVCVLATRKKAKNPWGDAYTKPKWLTAKQGSRANPHLQAQIEKIMADGDVDPAALFNPDGATLLSIGREGTGRTKTKYTVKVANGEFEGQDVTNFVLSDELREDIAAATAPGGSCDLVQVVADKFSPDHAEIREKLYGEKREGSDGGGSKPSMDED